MERYTKYLGEGVRLLSLIAVASLVLGFFIWNIYLVRLGVYEFNIIQARYIHSGIAFLFIFLPIAWVFYLAFRWLVGKVFHEKIKGEVLVYFEVLFLFAAVYFYSLLVFPQIPQSFGGAQPRVLSIIASEVEIEYLANFGIVKSSPIITENLCIAYENENLIMILLNDRVLVVNKENFKGFNSLPAKTRDQYAKICSEKAVGWALNQKEWVQ